VIVKDNGIIASYKKKCNIPITRADFIYKYRKKHASVRHEYYAMCDKYTDMDKCMFTFTVGGRGRGVYSKLRICNEIKSYLTYLIANSKDDIYFFTNIEIGQDLKNPHIHSQLWFSDKNAVRAIYDKVVTKFGLKHCKLSTPQQNHSSYNYVIKDYSKDLNDNELWHLEQTKKRMRQHLGTKLRFYSKSKSKYSQKAYRYFYKIADVTRDIADSWIEWFLDIFFNKEAFLSQAKSSFISIKIKEIECRKLFLLKRYFRQSLDILFISPARSPPSGIVLV